MSLDHATKDQKYFGIKMFNNIVKSQKTNLLRIHQ